jgi:hypothetical protein
MDLGEVPSLVTVTPLPNTKLPAPKAVSDPILIVPALTVVPPEKVFAPANVSTSAPAFVNPPEPDRTPLMVTALDTVTVELDVSDPVPPNVKAPLFVASPSVTVPPTEKPFVMTRAVVESLVSEPPERVSVPVPKAALFPTWSTPELKVAPPLKVFAPAKVSVPAPALSTPPVPLINPE